MNKEKEEGSEVKLYFQILKLLERNLDKEEVEKVDDYIQYLQLENQRIKEVLHSLNTVLNRHPSLFK
jgi:hypothetical protein